MGRHGSQVRLDTVQRREIFDRAGRPVADALRRSPEFDGAAIHLEWRPGVRIRRGQISDRGEEVHAAAFIRERRLVLDSALRRNPRELRRILVHELFHFAWIRLSNAGRRAWERLLAEEHKAGTNGELGWSAERRKNELTGGDVRHRTRRWREYACESFCDTAAFLFSGPGRHEEFTLAAAHRTVRKRWFEPLLRNKIRI